jgi:hypothetical protein
MNVHDPATAKTTDSKIESAIQSGYLSGFGNGFETEALPGARGLQSDWADNFVTTSEAFLEVMPDEWRDSVKEVADRVTSAVDMNDFLRG